MAELLDRDTKLSTNKFRNRYTHIVNGERFSLPTSEIVIWVGPGTQNYVFTDPVGVPRIDSISSSNASDNAILYIDGLIDDWTRKEQVKQLNGQNKVALDFPLIRINGMRATDKNLNGNVYAFEDDTVTAGVPNTLSKVKGFIDPTINEMHASVYTVPKNYQAILTNYNLHTAVTSNGILYVRFHICTNNGVRYRSANLPFSEGSTSVSNLTLPIKFPFPEKTDICVSTLAPLPGYGAFFNASFEVAIV